MRGESVLKRWIYSYRVNARLRNLTLDKRNQDHPVQSLLTFPSRNTLILLLGAGKHSTFLQRINQEFCLYTMVFISGSSEKLIHWKGTRRINMILQRTTCFNPEKYKTEGYREVLRAR